MYSIVKRIQDIGSLMNDLNDTDVIGLDTETTSLDPYTATVLLIQLNINGNIYLIDVRECEARLVKYLISLIVESNKVVVGHNLKFDIKMIYHLTGELILNVHDTMIVEMILNAGLNSQYPSLKDLISKYCKVIIDKDVRDSFINYTGAITNEQFNYSSIDVKYLFEIREKQIIGVKLQNQDRVVDLENGLVPCFSIMEYDGILLDSEKWKENVINNERSLQEIRNKIIDFIISNIDFTKYKTVFDVAKGLFITTKTTKSNISVLQNLDSSYASKWVIDNININSSSQMKTILNLLGINVENTNEKTLQKFKSHDLVKLLLEYRGIEKEITTYGLKFLEHINIVTGRIHTDWNQLVSTGRISSSSPNLQNQPRKDEFRSCYIAPEGKVIITADLSQAELRLMGAISGEPEFINSFVNKEDLHRMSATILYEKPANEITKEERHDGKTMNFGLIYGISEFGLYQNFGIPYDKGREWINKYFAKLQYIKAFIDLAGKAVVKNMFSVTPFGRKRFFENKVLFKSSKDEYSYISKVMREGINHIIQGGIADVIKLSMLNIFIKNPFGRNSFKILLQVHDELVIEADEDISEQAAKFIEQEMIDAFQPFLGVIPAVVDVNIDKKWSK